MKIEKNLNECKTLRLIAKITFVLGLAIGIAMMIMMAIYDSFDWSGVVLSISIAFFAILIWAFLKVIANISENLNKIAWAEIIKEEKEKAEKAGNWVKVRHLDSYLS